MRSKLGRVLAEFVKKRITEYDFLPPLYVGGKNKDPEKLISSFKISKEYQKQFGKNYMVYVVCDEKIKTKN